MWVVGSGCLLRRKQSKSKGVSEDKQQVGSQMRLQSHKEAQRIYAASQLGQAQEVDTMCQDLQPCDQCKTIRSQQHKSSSSLCSLCANADTKQWTKYDAPTAEACLNASKQQLKHSLSQLMATGSRKRHSGTPAYQGNDPGCPE